MKQIGKGMLLSIRSDFLFRLWIGVFAVIALATGINTWLSIRSLQTDAELEVKSRAEHLVDLLAKSLARPLFDVNGVAVQSVLETLGMEEVIRLVVRTPEGLVFEGPVGGQGGGGRGVSLTRRVDFDFGGRFYHVGDVELILSPRSVEQELNRQIWHAMTSWLMLVLGVSLIIYLLGRRITKPFAEILKALDHLADGETDVVLPDIHGTDQIGRLSVAITRFRQTLCDLKIADQKSAHLLLEMTVMANRLKAIYEGSSEAIVLLNEQGFIDCNHRAVEMFGLSSREALLCVPTGGLSPLYQPNGEYSDVLAKKHIKSAYEQGFQRFEWVFRHRDGHDFPGEILLSAFDYDGQRLLQATIRDTSERKRIEQALLDVNRQLEITISERTEEVSETLRKLAQSQFKLQLIVDTALDAVVMVQPDGRILGWNRQAEHIFGWSSAEVMGRMLDETIVPPSYRSAHRAGMEQYCASGIAKILDRRIEIFACHRDGHVFPIELAITRVDLDQDGQFEFCAFIRDITLRRQTEQEILASLERQKELAQLKSRFVTMASHEFRTPLATILSSTELLKNYSDRLPPDEREELFRNIVKAVRRMTGMLEDVLTIGKRDAEQGRFQPEPLMLDQFFRELISEVRSEYMEDEAQEIVIDLQCSGDSFGGLFDVKLLRHIFGNLLTNAIKYSPKNHCVKVILNVGSELCSISVEDQGIGIPEKDQLTLFDAFHRGSNVGNIPGTGLGLAIVKYSVELHGGKISVRSAEGQGTLFIVEIPRNERHRVLQSFADGVPS